MKKMKPGSFILLLTLLAAAIPSHSSIAQERRPPRDRMVIQIIELDYADAQQLASVIAPLLSPEGRVVAYTPTNTLIIRDKAYIVKRLVEITKGRAIKRRGQQLLIFATRTDGDHRTSSVQCLIHDTHQPPFS